MSSTIPTSAKKSHLVKLSLFNSLRTFWCPAMPHGVLLANLLQQKSLGLNPGSCFYVGLCPAARPLEVNLPESIQVVFAATALEQLAGRRNPLNKCSEPGRWKSLTPIKPPAIRLRRTAVPNVLPCLQPVLMADQARSILPISVALS